MPVKFSIKNSPSIPWSTFLGRDVPKNYKISTVQDCWSTPHKGKIRLPKVEQPSLKIMWCQTRTDIKKGVQLKFT